MDYKYSSVQYQDGRQYATKIIENSVKRRFLIDTHWHNSIELVLCYTGTLTIKINSKDHVLNEGDLLFINSAQFHSVRSEMPFRALVLNINLKSFGEYGNVIKSFLFDTDTTKDNLLSLLQMKQYLEELHLIAHQGDLPAIEFKAKACINNIIYLLLTTFRLEGVTYQSTVSSQKYVIVLSEITSYIESNFASSLTLEAVAQKFSYSPTYFSKFFKKYTKQSFSQYLAQVRLSHAYFDLLQTDLSLKEIAIKNGFPNVRSFSSTFKQTYGSLPTVYRKLMSGKRVEIYLEDE